MKEFGITLDGKIINAHRVGRYVNPDTGRPVNVWKGCRQGYDAILIFYYRSGRKVFISDCDFKKWRTDQEIRKEKNEAYLSHTNTIWKIGDEFLDAAGVRFRLVYIQSLRRENTFSIMNMDRSLVLMHPVDTFEELVEWADTCSAGKI